MDVCGFSQVRMSMVIGKPSYSVGNLVSHRISLVIGKLSCYGGD